MSLRFRLFLLVSALVALLLVAQGWLVRTLARDLSAEVGEMALSVGSSMATAVGGGELVLEERRVIENEAGKYHLSIIRRVRTGKQAEAAVWHEREAGEGSENHFQFQVETEEQETTSAAPSTVSAVEQPPPVIDGDAALEPSASAASSDQQEVTVVLLREGTRGIAPSLVVQGATGARAIPIPDRGLDLRVERFARRLQLGSLGLLGLGLLLAAAVAHRVSAPLRQLSAAARQVGEGKLGTQAPEPSDPEVALAVRSFNQMSEELARLARDTQTMRARRHLAELGEVARGLAHTLRNPLNALGLTVDELAARATDVGDDGDEQRSEGSAGDAESTAALAGAARQQIRRIDRSIRSFLLLAAQGAGSDVSTEPVELARLVDDVVLEAIQDCRRPVRIEVEPVDQEAGDPGPVVHGVSAELRAVLQALIVNAVEASPDGGTVRVRLASGPASAAGSEGDSTRATIEVIDEGAGLAPQIRDRLFEPHLTTKPEGSGMGLFLSHRIVSDRYGGRLTLEDAATDQGTPRGTRARLELGDRHAVSDRPAPPEATPDA
jgi:signal transduction histidine kinase